MFSVVGLTFLLIAGVFAGAIVMALRGGAGFELSRVIGDAGTAIGRAPLIFAGLGVAATGVPGLLAVLGAVGSPDLPMLATWPTAFGLGLIAFAWYQLCTMAMVVATLEALDGRVRIATVLARSLPVVPQAMLTSVLYWAAVFAGFVFFVVPGAILACVWMLVLPVLAEERPSPFAVFGRAARLSRGVRWQLFLLAAIGFVFGTVVQGLLGGLAALLGGGWMSQAAFVLLSSLLSVLPPALVASAYRQRVAAIEGPRRRELEEIFA
ncbi:hypothetical protein [Sphingomonas sp. Y38-1Y]|uniref:hypothetical protein n=1 Tax=Sphingomonas sp. Y38-1Y TaxID=3078265 RepID=UPI0028EFC240|nr:hypothetical protein [Sphingomonas sp. Y38-1Y]